MISAALRRHQERRALQRRVLITNDLVIRANRLSHHPPQDPRMTIMNRALRTLSLGASASVHASVVVTLGRLRVRLLAALAILPMFTACEAGNASSDILVT